MDVRREEYIAKERRERGRERAGESVREGERERGRGGERCNVWHPLD